MGEHQSHTQGSNVLAFTMNVASAVTIVFVNKVLMDHKRGYAFTFGELLAAGVAGGCVVGVGGGTAPDICW